MGEYMVMVLPVAASHCFDGQASLQRESESLGPLLMVPCNSVQHGGSYLPLMDDDGSSVSPRLVQLKVRARPSTTKSEACPAASARVALDHSCSCANLDCGAAASSVSEQRLLAKDPGQAPPCAGCLVHKELAYMHAPLLPLFLSLVRHSPHDGKRCLSCQYLLATRRWCSRPDGPSKRMVYHDKAIYWPVTPYCIIFGH